MFNYRIVSVPTTGTRFTAALLNMLKVDCKRSHVTEKDYGLDVIDVPANERMVIPWRDPGNVYISRCQRRETVEAPLSLLLGQYERMENMLALYPKQCMILPIDKPLAPNYWQEFTKFLNANWTGQAVRYIQAWRKVGAFDYRYTNKEVPAEIQAIRERWGYA
jgi:hypothetical protein